MFRRFTLGCAGSLAVVGLSIVPSEAAAGRTVALWNMNEGASASVMVDSSGNGVNGRIGSAVQTNVAYSGATGYVWAKTDPNAPPAKPERHATVDSDALNPGTGDYAVTVRFRTTHSAGNMIQKGQAGARGGYFKMQNVRGKITCLFRGRAADGTTLSKAVNSGLTPLNDGAWHTIRCERTSDRVEMFVDGAAKPRRALGPTGSISNSVPLAIAGKLNCDQVNTTCDYFSGAMDYVRIEKGGS